ncbi:MAG: hypothetical protein HFI37_06505 [Lachnospiraceae bacterium]|nr:hypothetical protein [Lachnospiraceae bacterium]
MTLPFVETTVPIDAQAAAKTTTMSKSITFTTSKTIKTKYVIKSVKSSKSFILSAKKTSSKKFKVTSKYKYGSAVVTVKRTTKSASVYGFGSSGPVYKSRGHSKHKADGTYEYEINFFCDGSEYWIDRNVTFEVEDVTPLAYAKVFSDLGIPYRTSTVKKESAASLLREVEHLNPVVFEPCTGTGPVKSDVRATAGKILKVSAARSAGVLKLIAKQGSKVLDYIYLQSYGFDEGSPEGSKPGDQLYIVVRHKIEAALWKPGMTKAQKLGAIADYINSTNHYPGSPTILKKVIRHSGKTGP